MANLMQHAQHVGDAPKFRMQPGTEGSAYLSSDLEAEFRRSYNRTSFGFPHGLADHPLFSLPNLVALASRIENNGHNYYSSGKIDVSDNWSTGVRDAGSLADVV